MNKQSFIKELSNKLNFSVAKFRKSKCFQYIQKVLDNPDFYIWSGSSSSENHHYGKGQLAQHTLEVAELCIDVYHNNSKFGNTNINWEVLSTAAIWHDYGKLFDYVPTNSEKTEWKGADHKRRIHHISRSAIEWEKWAAENDFESDFIENVTHCILSHHGRREWGSPVAPLTREAWVLHLCDNLSARMNDCDKSDRLKVKGESRSSCI